MFWITFTAGEQKGQRRRIQRRNVVIGKDLSCQIWLADEFAAPRHAEIDETAGVAVIRALDPSAPVRVNGAELTEATLADGDIIEVGRTTIRFQFRRSAVLDALPRVVGYTIFIAAMIGGGIWLWYRYAESIGLTTTPVASARIGTGRKVSEPPPTHVSEDLNAMEKITAQLDGTNAAAPAVLPTRRGKPLPPRTTPAGEPVAASPSPPSPAEPGATATAVVAAATSPAAIRTPVPAAPVSVPAPTTTPATVAVSVPAMTQAVATAVSNVPVPIAAAGSVTSEMFAAKSPADTLARPSEVSVPTMPTPEVSVPAAPTGTPAVVAATAPGGISVPTNRAAEVSVPMAAETTGVAAAEGSVPTPPVVSVPAPAPAEDPAVEAKRSIRNKSEAALKIAQVLISRGEMARAGEYLNAVEKADPEYLPAVVERARMEERAGRLDLAEKAWIRVLQRSLGDPLYDTACTELARLAERQIAAAPPPLADIRNLMAASPGSAATNDASLSLPAPEPIAAPPVVAAAPAPVPAPVSAPPRPSPAEPVVISAKPVEPVVVAAAAPAAPAAPPPRPAEATPKPAVLPVPLPEPASPARLPEPTPAPPAPRVVVASVPSPAATVTKPPVPRPDPATAKPARTDATPPAVATVSAPAVRPPPAAPVVAPKPAAAPAMTTASLPKPATRPASVALPEPPPKPVRLPDMKIMQVDARRFPASHEYDDFRMLRVDIRVAPDTPEFRQDLVSIDVQFFDQAARSGAVFPSRATSTTQPPVTAKAAWKPGESRSATATYLVPTGTRRKEEYTREGPGHFYGYRARLYYDGRLLDERVKPETLPH